MTTPIDALERIRDFPHGNSPSEQAMSQLARQALASLEGDAVERVALRRTVLDILNSVAPAVENLACNQEQADADGCMVKVSRQAVDEVLAAVNEVAIQAATATGLVAGEAAIRAAEREKCEHRVEELDCLYINDERCPFGGIPADPETSIRREAIKECLAAIRSGGAK
jgi:hypothetical protein